MEINIPENPEERNPSLTLGVLNRFFVPVLVVLVGVGGFGLGKLSKIQETRTPVTVESLEDLASVNVGLNASTTTETTKNPEIQVQKRGNYVAARGGTVYYLPSCPASNRISEKNKIWFDTKAEAEKLGYKPASACKGL